MTSTAAWAEFQRGTMLIHRVKEFGFAHPEATVDSTLTALHEEVTADNTLYVGIGLCMAEQSRDRAVRAGLAQVPLGEGWKPNEEGDSTMDFDPDELRWFKSSRSAAGACVQVAHTCRTGLASRSATPTTPRESRITSATTSGMPSSPERRTASSTGPS